MNLKLFNTLAVALVGCSWFERRRRRAFLALSGLAAAVDLAILVVLMTQRHAMSQVSTGLNTVQLVHILSSSVFPILYPFLLVAAAEAEDPGDARTPVVPTGLLLAFLASRILGYVTSYWMAP